jgi:hypothetical protein
VVDQEGVPQMDGVGPKVLDRKELLDLMLKLLISMLDKQDRGLRPIWGLARLVTKVLKNGFDAGFFTNISFTIDDEILCKEKAVYWWAARAECDSRKVFVI